MYMNMKRKYGIIDPGIVMLMILGSRKNQAKPIENIQIFRQTVKVYKE